MPKRKESSSEFPSRVDVLYETCNKERLRWCGELLDIKHGTEEIIDKRLSVKSAWLATKIASNEGAETYLGRQYGGTFQGCETFVVRMCLHETHREIDVCNCGPTLLLQILQQLNIAVPDIVQQYCEQGGRERVFALIKQEHPALDDNTLKKMFLAGISGGKHTSSKSQHRNGTHFTKPIQLVMEWENCWQGLCTQLQSTERYARFDWVPWPRAISLIWQEAEALVNKTLRTFFADVSIQTGTSKFDSILLETRKEITDETLRSAERYIKSFTNFAVVLKEVDLTPTDADWERYWGPKKIERMVPASVPNYLLAREGQVNKLKRHGTNIMTPHPMIPGVYLPREDASTYINRVLLGHACLQQVKMAELELWFATVDHPKFELLTSSKIRQDVISFRNGYLHTGSMEFHEWKDVEIAPITDHYFDQEVDPSRAPPTPLWTSILTSQLPADQAEFFEVLVGRLFYPVATHDGWQVCPMILGDANTGKSSICDIVAKMFPFGSAGLIGARIEKTFGMMSLYEKRVIIVADMPDTFHQVIPQSEFQSIISGDGISVPVKYGGAVQRPWKSQLLMAGNFLPKYKDASGSISRRIVTFKFETLIQSRNTRMKEEIIETELAYVLIRCIALYRNFCDRIGSADIWKNVPKSLAKSQAELKAKTSYLLNFLQNGDEFYQVLHADKCVHTTKQQLNKAFKNHMKNVHGVLNAQIGDDLYPIKSAGYEVQNSNLCKTCHSVSSVATCKGHYNAENRYTRMIIKGMKLLQRERKATTSYGYTVTDPKAEA